MGMAMGKVTYCITFCWTPAARTYMLNCRPGGAVDRRFPGVDVRFTSPIGVTICDGPCIFVYWATKQNQMISPIP